MLLCECHKKALYAERRNAQCCYDEFHYGGRSRALGMSFRLLLLLLLLLSLLLLLLFVLLLLLMSHSK